MNRKYEFSVWDYRPWLMLLVMMVVVFWFLFGAYCHHVGTHALAPEKPVPMFLNQISFESIQANWHWWMIGFGLSMIVVVLVTIKSANSLLNNRSITSIEDELLLTIPVCTDSEILEFNNQLGIIVTAEQVCLPQSILRRASPEALAHDLSVLLYLKFPEIDNMTRLGRHTAFHSLADQLLGYWKHDRIVDFVAAMSQEKDYLGTMLDTALKRRQLELQVIDLQKQINDCCEQEAHATDDLRSSRNLASQFSEYEELRQGKSAAVKWFKSKVSKAKKTFLRNPE